MARLRNCSTSSAGGSPIIMSIFERFFIASLSGSFHSFHLPPELCIIDFLLLSYHTIKVPAPTSEILNVRVFVPIGIDRMNIGPKWHACQASFQLCHLFPGRPSPGLIRLLDFLPHFPRPVFGEEFLLFNSSVQSDLDLTPSPLKVCVL